MSRANSWLRLAALGLGIVALGLIGGISVLAIVFAIVVSIFLHELGHFVVAKRAGMKVTEFFIGFGPRIWSFQRGETEYGVKVLPAGAYVRIIGMHNLEQVDPADEARTYRAQPYRKRLPVVLAGPFANFAIAFVLLFAIFVGWGQPNDERWTVDRVVAGSAADQAGLQPGDRIVSFNGEPVTDFTSLSDLIASSPGGTVTIDVRARRPRQLSTTAPLGWRLDAEAASALAPLRSGDQVLSVNGQDVSTYDVLAAQLASADTGTATVVFDRQGFRYETEVATPAQLPADGYAGFLGVGPEVQRDRLDPVAAVGEATTSFGPWSQESVGRRSAIASRRRASATTSTRSPAPRATTTRRPRRRRAIRPLEADAPTRRLGRREPGREPSHLDPRRRSASAPRPPTAAPSRSSGCS